MKSDEGIFKMLSKSSIIRNQYENVTPINLMNSLDLVISSDTSIIHLAGILNIKSVLLLNYNSQL